MWAAGLARRSWLTSVDSDALQVTSGAATELQQSTPYSSIDWLVRIPTLGDLGNSSRRDHYLST